MVTLLSDSLRYGFHTDHETASIYERVTTGMTSTHSVFRY